MEFKLDEQQETEIKTYVLNVVKDAIKQALLKPQRNCQIFWRCRFKYYILGFFRNAGG